MDASRAGSYTRPVGGPRRARSDLPEGRVTLLFTDIEGSTQLLRALGDRYVGVQDRHRQLLRNVFDRHGGVEVDTQGDAFMVAFPSAGSGAAAAADAQRALASEPWPDGARVRVRIGLHTGEPDRGPEGYVGMDVHVAARICSAGHGGQIVTSRALRDLVGDDPASDITFRPLGSHRLKDVPAPVQLFQLIALDLPETFPPLRTLGGATLPALHHRLVGRRRDLTTTLALLSRPDVRLITITGPGGAGKSRLALEVAGLAAVERPVHLVGLAPISDPEVVPAAIARSLGVRETGSRPLVESIADALSGTRALLVLDNLEHLAPAALDVAALLDRTPDLDVLVTSRAPLRLAGEHVVPLRPLTVDDAATLFSELTAARGVVLREDSMSAVREICERLDGLPLAIELVAARLAVLPPEQLLRALDEGLTLHMEGPVDLPERQRTLHATIDWSYGLLTESQRELHKTLAVFMGGCTLQDGRDLAGSQPSFLADLEALVSGSLLRSDITDGGARLYMLETVREDALARLAAAGELEDLRRRHAEMFVELATAAEHELTGPDQRRWLDLLERELDNIRATLAWCLSSARVEDALRAVSGLGRFWRMHGHITEARRWLSRALMQADGVSAEVVANALWWSARQAAAQDDLNAEIPLLEDALALFRELGRTREAAFALGELGWIALQQGQTARAEELCDEALAIARSTGNAETISGQLNYLADIYSARGDHLRAIAAHEEALALRRALDDPHLVTNSTYNLGIAAWENGEIVRARSAFEDTHALARELGDVIHSAAADFMLAELDLAAGDVELAAGRILGCFATYTDLESERSRAECLVVLGGIACAKGDFEEAGRRFGAAQRLRGDSPLNRFEVPVLERWAPKLEERLGAQRAAELEAEGAQLGADVLISRVVTSA